MDNSGKKFCHPIEFELLAEEYFARQLENKKPFTLAGLARYMGFSKTGTLAVYRTADTHADFHDVAGAAYLRIEEFANEQLYNKNTPPAGPIFYLKSAFKYRDKHEGEKDAVHIYLDGIAKKL